MRCTLLKTFLLSSRLVSEVGRKIIPTAYSPAAGRSHPMSSCATCDAGSIIKRRQQQQIQQQFKHTRQAKASSLTEVSSSSSSSSCSKTHHRIQSGCIFLLRFCGNGSISEENVTKMSLPQEEEEEEELRVGWVSD